MGEGDGFEGTRHEMDRAIRRLNALELVMFGAALVVALLGGAVVAFFLNRSAELPFRLTWGVASVLLLVLPGLAVFARERRGEGTSDRSGTQRKRDGT